MPLHPGLSSPLTDQMYGHLIAAGLIPDGGVLTPLAGGRTNRLWRADTPDGALVAKLFAGAANNPLFGNDPAAEARLLKFLHGTGLAPRYHASLDTPLGHVLLYEYVDGQPWRDDPVCVAQAMARLHDTPPPKTPDLPIIATGSDDITRQTQDILLRCPSAEASRLLDLEPKGRVPATDTMKLLHGDIVPGNIICRAQTLTFIDWQCPAMGDPAHDLAVFLSPAMQFAYRGTPLSPSEEDHFLAAYDRPTTTDRFKKLAPWLHWRMAAYCLWRASQGADDYRRALALECGRLMS